MKSMKGKLDTTKIIKSVSREAFAGVDVRTRVVPDKRKRYVRKQKHRGKDNW